MNRRLRQLGIGLIGTFLLWVITLAVAGWAAKGCAKDKATRRVADSMKAEVTIGDLELGLITGAIGLDKVHIVRSDRGYFRLDIKRVDIDVLPLGLALFQDSVGDVKVRGVEVEVSALGALDLRGGSRAPLTFDSLDIRDARITLEATSLVPGLASLTVTIEKATAGATTLRTPMSWLFALRELVARVELPMGVTARVAYRAGKLTLSGELFDTPVEVPFEIPVLDPGRELEQLRQLGRRLVEELTKDGLQKWLKNRAKQDLLDRVRK